MRIAVIGGSIAGCASAAVLLHNDHDLTVFERSSEELVGQGAGILTPLDVLDQMVAAELLDESFPRCEVSGIYYRRRGDDGGVQPIGHVDMPLAAIDWADLFSALRSHVPDGRYFRNAQVLDVDETERAAPRLRLLDGTLTEPFDVVVFADGHRSIGRRLVSPGAKTTYQGVVFWRGLLPESAVDADDLTGTVVRVVDADGHGVIYVIPAHAGAGRQVMWGWYLPVSTEDLGTMLTDKSGVRHHLNVSFGSISGNARSLMEHALERRVPTDYLQLIRRTRATSLQAIERVDVTTETRGRLCLVGDAGAVAPPFSGSGVLKAVGNALTLGQHLSGDDAPTESLATWNADQHTLNAQIMGLADRNGRLLVFEVPKLAGLDNQSVMAWLNAVHPDALAHVD